MKLHQIANVKLPQEPVVSLQQKALVEKKNRERLEQELREKRFELTPLPYEAHIQFSNFCNMSCIMCWNGNNPKTMKLTDELQHKIQTQLGPELSILEPFSGSEPLVLTWEETRDLAEKYGVMLCLTTNVQYLDEEKFYELKDITETLYLSVDCHIPEVLEKIRQRANTDKVLENVRTAALLAREHNVECAINIVFLTYNAPFLADSVKAFSEMGIETINVIQLVDINHQSGFFDPLIHYSDEFLQWIKQQTIDAAREAKIRLMWNVGPFEVHEFRENPTPPKPRKVDNDHWDWRMKHLLPGFCRNSYNRIRIEVNGNVAPCCYATEGQLSFGNLKEMDFDDIWNGKPAQDLRRGMYTDDVPTLCKNCLVRMPPAPTDDMLFTNEVRFVIHPQMFGNEATTENRLQSISPKHLERLSGPPVVQFETPFANPECLLAVALGGECQQIETVVVNAEISGDGLASFPFPQSIWEKMETNLGYWWTIWQFTGDEKTPNRTEDIRCVIRHEGLPRLAGSTLAYDSEEDCSTIVDIGANKSFGFSDNSNTHQQIEQMIDQKTESLTVLEKPISMDDNQTTTDEQAVEPVDINSNVASAPKSNGASVLEASIVEKTGRLMNEARELLAYGGLDGVMNRPLLHSDGTYPQFATSATGYRLTDSTGQEFIDWVNGWGCNFLGHAHPVVNQAVVDQLQKGCNFGLMNPIEVDVARRLTELVPCAEKVAFGKNGSDGLNAAIRIARAATGREIILQCGFHGFHEWYTCLHEGVKGILPVLRDYIIPFEYNDIEALNALFEEHKGRVAGIVMEPVNMFMPGDGYLAAVKSLAHENESLLIFDEVVTAFRLANGGAQEYFNVTPDLACLGKALGNGLPLSAVVGKSEFMQHLPSVAYGMTFRGETLSLAAAQAVLEFVVNHDVPGHLEDIGEQVREQFHLLAARHDIRCELQGPASRMTFVFHNQGAMTWQQLRSLFVLECLKHGVLTNGNLLASFAHDQQAVTDSLQVFDRSLGTLRQVIDQSDTSLPNAARPPFDGAAVDINGFLDSMEMSTDKIDFGGWLLIDSAVVTEIEVV